MTDEMFALLAPKLIKMDYVYSIMIHSTCSYLIAIRSHVIFADGSLTDASTPLLSEIMLKHRNNLEYLTLPSKSSVELNDY